MECPRWIRWLSCTPALVMALVTGCVAAPDDGVRGLEPHLRGPADFEEAWRERPDDADVRRLSDELIDEPLGMDEAVRVALLNHPGVQADIHSIDVAEGRLRQEAVIGNPELELEAYLTEADGGLQRWEPEVTFDVGWLFDRAGRLAATSSGIEAARIEAAGRVVEFVTDVRGAWIDHVAAVERLERIREIDEAARAIAESARLHHEAGNLAGDELRRFEAHAAESKLAVINAEQQAVRTENTLHDRLGIDSDRRDWSVPGELPELPDELPAVDERIDEMVQRNIEARRLRQRTEQLEAQQRLERRRGWLPRLGVGVTAEVEPEAVEFGPVFRLHLPVFDRRARARDALAAESIQADLRRRQALRSTHIAARELDERLTRAYRAVEHYESQLLPLRRELVEETLRQYNAMAVSALELLETRREQLETERDYVDARRGFWRAYVQFEHLLAGGTQGSGGWSIDESF